MTKEIIEKMNKKNKINNDYTGKMSLNNNCEFRKKELKREKEVKCC